MRVYLRKITIITFFSVIGTFILLQKQSQREELNSSKISCGRLPQEEDILVDHVIWQALLTPRGSYRLLNAYFDDRQNKTVVRVIMIGDQLNVTKDEFYCQFWLDEEPDSVPIVTKATQYILIWPESEIPKNINFQ
jgi:hypothetical protein